ncbi:MAG: hypothetical protein LC118_00170 [Dehalococcoidia bacterium]|nr:hypothetical protein [Dehalococcoidia bacterium]
MAAERTTGTVPGQRRDQLERVREAYEEAVARAGVVERRFLIAGHLVAIQFAGSALVPYLTPAFSHLERDDAGWPDLVIRVFDSSSTGVQLPLTGEEIAALSEAGMPGRSAVDGVAGGYQRPDSGLSLMEIGASDALYWAESPMRIPYWERGGPFRGILSWYLGTVGTRFVHAAGIALEGRGILIAAPGGSGKSTTALTCMASGWDYAGDDYIAVTGRTRRVHSLYRSAKLEPWNVHRVPWIEGTAVNESRLMSEKAVYLPSPCNGGKVITDFEYAGVVIPRIGKACRIEPTTKAEALRAIAPSTILQLGSTDTTIMAQLAQIVRDVPAYRLELGEDMSELPMLLASLVRI